MTGKKKKIIIVASALAALVVIVAVVVFSVVWYRHPGWARDLRNESLGEARVLALKDELAEKQDKKILVAYFSYSGNTERAANAIADSLGADLFEIDVANPYTDLYAQSNSEIRRGDKPELARTVENIGIYDVVFVGYPIWWHATPAPINTFLTVHDLSGKLVIPFCTSQECPIDETMPTFLDSCEGIAVYGSKRIADIGEIAEWLSSLGIFGDSTDNGGGNTDGVQGSTLPVNGELYNTSSVYAKITITAGNTTLDAVLFDNKTARAVADMLPLTVPSWHPAPDFARAFDLPESFSYFEDEPPQMSYELGSLAYWQPGPSIAMIYKASRTQTVVPVVPIGKITSDVSVLANYGGELVIKIR